MTDRTRNVRRYTSTVRFRISAVATLLVATVLVAAGFAIGFAQRAQLTDNLEDSVRARADVLEVSVRSGDFFAAVAGLDDDTVVQVVDRNGEVVAQSAELDGREPIVDGSGDVPDGANVWRTVDRLGGDQEAFRVLSRRVDTPDGPVIVHVAADLDDVRESTTVLGTTLAIAIPIIVVLFAVLAWWLVGRALRPVEEIRREAATIGGDALDHRLSVPPGGDEIARLARTMNAMLDRIEHASRRQQQFVADASHELRSPLTRMRSELEVDAAHPESADRAATHRSVLEETIALQQLVDDLLQLARADAGAVPVARQPVDLDDIVVQEAGRLRAAGTVTVDTSAVSGAQVVGDRTQLTRAVRNVVDNAARHASSTVTFTLGERDESAVLTIADDGAGIPEAARDRVFERFTRLDGARGVDDGGTGLGLAIAREIVHAHGGRIEIDADHTPGTRLVIELPLE